MKFWPTDCKTGDMIRVKLGSVYHFGIFVSEDEVIQFGEPPVAGLDRDSAAIKVISTDIDTFACGNTVEVAVLSFGEKLKRFSPKKTVSLARKRLGEGGYNLLYNNCEHFVNECVFGISKSEQVESIRRQVTASKEEKH